MCAGVFPASLLLGQQSAARGTSPVNATASNYTAESLPLASVQAEASASTWGSKLRSPFVVAGLLAVLAVVVALVLGGGASPSSTAPASAPAVAMNDAASLSGGGAGRKFDVVDQLDAQIRELEEQNVWESGDFFDTSL